MNHKNMLTLIVKQRGSCTGISLTNCWGTTGDGKAIKQEEICPLSDFCEYSVDKKEQDKIYKQALKLFIEKYGKSELFEVLI